MNTHSKHRDLFRLTHILEQSNIIISYVDEGVSDQKTELAIERCIEIIGEACRAVSDETKIRHPDIPWQKITSMRNVLVHEYYQLDKETIWDIAEHKIPALRDWVSGIINELEGGRIND